VRLALLLAAAIICVPVRAADWPLERGNSQQTGWQKYETSLTPASVKGLQLLWKYQLSAAGTMTLATPTMLGRVITHRGIKELVFATGSSGTLVALDSDLGTVFWKRDLETAIPAQRNCQAYPMPSPVITPAPPPAGLSADDEAADPTHGNRPLYLLTVDGKVRAISPITGLDISTPIDFLPAHLPVSSLSFFANTLYAVTADSCESEPGKVWAVQVHGHASVASWPARAVTVGTDGTAYLTVAGDILETGSLTLQNLYLPVADADKVAGVAPVFFTWRGQGLLAASTRQGRNLLLDAKAVAMPSNPVFRSEPSVNNGEGAPQVTGLASWESPDGARWIYLLNGRIRAFKLEANHHSLVMKPIWESAPLYHAAAPVVANGVLYTLAASRSPDAPASRLTLYALDAATGQKLYSSSEVVTAGSHSGLAVANGHVCFGTSGQTIYCFGLPFDP